MNLQEELVKYLKECRIADKISQKSVAGLLKISGPQFNLYENNKQIGRASCRERV